MISKVSFTSTYKVDNKNQDSFSKFQEYALLKGYADGVTTCLKDTTKKRGSWGNLDYYAVQTLIVPDAMDFDVETFCANNGISYTKFDTKDLLNPKAVQSRIAPAPKCYRKVNIDAKKLEELAKNQNSNLSHCRRDYERYYLDSVDTILRKGEDIPATTLIIQDPSGNDDLRRYVKKYGADRLNNEQINVNFIQKRDIPDHCVYFALKDMKIDKIPVYVNNESYEAGCILGLFNRSKVN